MKILAPLILLSTIIGCKEVDCNDVKQAFYPEEYNLIVEESNVDLTWIKIRGHVPETYKNSNIMVHNNWRFDSASVDFGDTVVKRRGSLNITVHKKDTTLLFDWYCRGKTYK